MEREKSSVASNCSPAGEEVVSAVFSADACALAIGSCTPGDLLSDKAELSNRNPATASSEHSSHACKRRSRKEFLWDPNLPTAAYARSQPAAAGVEAGAAPNGTRQPCAAQRASCVLLGASWVQEEPLLFADLVCPKAAQGTPKKGPGEPWSRGRSASSPSTPYLHAVSSWLQPPPLRQLCQFHKSKLIRAGPNPSLAERSQRCHDHTCGYSNSDLTAWLQARA